MSSRAPLPQRFSAEKVIVVLRSNQSRHIDTVTDVLVSEGLGCLEVTFTIPDAEDVIGRLVKRFGMSASVGAGTVTTRERAVAAIDAGADYLVSPTYNAEVARIAEREGVPYLPGAFTPTEIAVAWAGGASAVKLFPASALQPSYAKAVLGPMPDLVLMPSGGVALDAISGWLEAGALAVSLGGELIGDALDGGSLKSLWFRARTAAGFR